MSPFWTSLFENLRNCGQNATLFMVALGGFFAFLAIAALIFGSASHQDILRALPWIALLLLAWGWTVARRFLTRRRQRALRSPLSRDELRVARSKLVKEQKQKRP